MSDSQQKGPPAYSAEQVTQGNIILQQPWQHIVFMTGLAAAVLLPLALGVHYFR